MYIPCASLRGAAKSIEDNKVSVFYTNCLARHLLCHPSLASPCPAYRRLFVLVKSLRVYFYFALSFFFLLLIFSYYLFRHFNSSFTLFIYWVILLTHWPPDWSPQIVPDRNLNNQSHDEQRIHFPLRTFVSQLFISSLSYLIRYVQLVTLYAYINLTRWNHSAGRRWPPSWRPTCQESLGERGNATYAKV